MEKMTTENFNVLRKKMPSEARKRSQLQAQQYRVILEAWSVVRGYGVGREKRRDAHQCEVCDQNIEQLRNALLALEAMQ
jgi:hypothetical protein